MIVIFSAETKRRFMSHMMFRAFERNRVSGPRFHTYKKKKKKKSDSLGKLAKDVFLNCVFFRFLFRISNALS